MLKLSLFGIALILFLVGETWSQRNYECGKRICVRNYRPFCGEREDADGRIEEKMFFNRCDFDLSQDCDEGWVPCKTKKYV
ncbi:unnamed protein product [Nezara viridula]|uniref:Neuropeptide n=1 Tax=Nezara viridula TaxID=85310 RepID=A0A9P0HT20_NEZVI|nr:unnamed protein product [Nezara viridula]